MGHSTDTASRPSELMEDCSILGFTPTPRHPGDWRLETGCTCRLRAVHGSGSQCQETDPPQTGRTHPCLLRRSTAHRAPPQRHSRSSTSLVLSATLAPINWLVRCHTRLSLLACEGVIAGGSCVAVSYQYCFSISSRKHLCSLPNPDSSSSCPPSKSRTSAISRTPELQANVVVDFLHPRAPRSPPITRLLYIPSRLRCQIRLACLQLLTCCANILIEGRAGISPSAVLRTGLG